MKCPVIGFILLALMFPPLIYAQLIDNRALPPEELLQRAPFIPTDRAAVRSQDTGRFYVMDNADYITIQDYPEDKVTEVTMIGNVRIRFQANYVRAEKLIVTIKNSTAIGISASGSVEFTLNEGKYLAESIYYQPKASRGIMYDVRSTLGSGLVAASQLPWFYRAERASIQGKNRFVLENVVMSTSDARFEHFSIYAKKVWFVQGKVTLAFGIQYKVGQAGFIWLPAYFQMDGLGPVHTSFGSDRRAGYYFINNISLTNKAGSFGFGFDIYERLGQYFTFQYTAPSVGMLKEFDLTVNLANDSRITYTNIPYSQWLNWTYTDTSNQTVTADRNRINQFSWHYKLNTSIATNGVSVKLTSEYLNDPFFLQKYSYRTTFASRKEVNFFGLINQGIESFHGYNGDTAPASDTLNQKLSVALGKMNITMSFDLGRLRNTSEANPFLNSAYYYSLRSMTLPDITLNPGSLTLGSYDRKDNSLIAVVDSRGWKYSVLPYELAALEQRLAKQKKQVILRSVVTNEDGRVSWVAQTNYEPVRITNQMESPYTWIAFSSTATVTASFSGTHTFGSNINGVNDPRNTSWRIVNDNYKHKETGSVNANINFLNNLISIGNSLDGSYGGQWSSFVSDFTNNLRSTTFTMDYRLTSTISSNFVWRDEDLTRIAMPFSTSFGYSHPIMRYNAFDDLSTIKEGNLTWSTKLGWELLQWRRTPIFKIDGEIGIVERYRFPTEAQRFQITNRSSVGDPYYNDKTYSRLKVSGTFSLWWLGVGTSADIDLLTTATNNVPLFDNSRYASDPILNLVFKPDARFHYLPSLTYNYRIHSNQNATIDLVWNLHFQNLQIPKLYPFIYEISEIGFIFNYHHDFQNVRNSSLRLSFVLAIKFTRYLTLRFESSMKNVELYRYYPSASGAPAEKNFWEDLGNSLKIWDLTALQNTSFKLEGITVELIHDLQTWDMRLQFRLRNVLDTQRQVAYWEPFIGIAFTMKGSSATSIFPEYTRKLVPNEYQ